MDEMRLYYLVEGSVNGTLTAEEALELDAWLAASEQNRAAATEIKEILDFSKVALDAVAPETDLEWAAIQSRMHTADPVPMVIRPPFWSKPQTWAAAAAIALLVTVGGYFGFFRGNGQSEQGLHFASAAGQRQEIKLADGTVVTLQGGSKLDAEGSYGHSHRHIQLQGEAYFDVAKDKSKPFVVTSGTTKAEALGTEFNVRMSRRDGGVEVGVTEGTVRFSEARGESITLIQGDVAKYDPATGKISKVAKNAGDAAAWKENKLIFNDAQFTEAAERIEAHYGVTLHFPERLNAARLTANFDAKPLADVLSVLEVVYSLHSSQSGQVVTLSE